MTVLAASTLGAGAIGFLVVLVLCVAAFFLFRSMSKHLRKVPASFDPASSDHAASDHDDTPPSDDSPARDNRPRR